MAIKGFFGGLHLSLLTGIFNYLAWINLALGIFNLIPGFPLDGGRVFRALYWWKSGSLTRATHLAADLGKGFAVALMFWGGLQIFMGGPHQRPLVHLHRMFLRGLSKQGYEEVIMRTSLEGVQVRDLMIREVVSVCPGPDRLQLVHDYFLHYAFRASRWRPRAGCWGWSPLPASGMCPGRSRTSGRLWRPWFP